MAWINPALPQMNTPSVEWLQKNPFQLGDAKFYLLPKQWEFMWCRERYPNYTGGYGSGKTQAGIYRGALLSMQPDNLGIVGRSAETQLELTTKRDFMQFLYDAKLLKSEPNKKHGAIVYCVDPKTNKPIGKTSEVQFDHMEDPDHIHGSHTGWFWMDERAESPFASFLKLVGRNRRPNIPFRSGFATGNPNGHDWGYDFWFNPQKILALAKEIQLERRAIHATSYENYYLDPQYIKDMESAYPEEWLKRYLLGDMDVFEGQIFKEFLHNVHCVNSRQCGFVNGEPPESWPRYQGIDVGGTDPWAFEYAAVDPWENVIFYNEIYRPGEYVDQFAHDAKLIMKDRRFVTVIDWENKLASAELKRHGIQVHNARKRGKMDSITNMGGYLHPNPKRAFPSWHPMAGQPGSPGVFFTEQVPNLIREVPQQRWKKVMGTDISLNQLDDKVSNHAFDAALYILRERPRPESLKKVAPHERMTSDIDKRSAAYYLMEMAQEKYKENRSRIDRIYLPFQQRTARHAWN